MNERERAAARCGRCRHWAGNLGADETTSGTHLCWSPKPRAVTHQTVRTMGPDEGEWCPAFESRRARIRNATRAWAIVGMILCVGVIPSIGLLLILTAGVVANALWSGDGERVAGGGLLLVVFVLALWGVSMVGTRCYAVATSKETA